MKPYYEDDSVTLYHGDCRDVLPALPSAALILTDIPYAEVNRATGGLRSIDKGSADVATFAIEPFVAECVRISLGSFYIFCGVRQVSDIARAFDGHGLTVRSGGWRKTNPSPMNGEHLWLTGFEHCVFARKTKAVFNERCQSVIWSGPTDQEDWGHATPKPRWLFERLIRASTNPGDLVIDPCCGGGTTLRAAKDSGRKGIGIELVEKNCETTAQRLSQETLGLDVA